MEIKVLEFFYIIVLYIYFFCIYIDTDSVFYLNWISSDFSQFASMQNCWISITVEYAATDMVWFENTDWTCADSASGSMQMI